MKLKKIIIYLIVFAILSMSISIPNFADRNVSLFYQEPSKQNKIDLFFAGDLMLHGAQFKSSYDNKSKNYQFKDWFYYFIEPINNADYSLLNLETTITDNPAAYSGFPLFKSPHHILYDLKSVGFDGVVTANNHSLDGGLKGILTTIDHLVKSKLDYTGTAPMGQKVKPLLIEKNGLKVALINATYGTNGMAIPKDHPTAINLISTETIDAQMTAAKALNPDAIIAYVHWGVEYQRKPNSYQREWAIHLAELGADAIIGAHPHSVQPEEWLKTSDGRSVYVNYSLGNFVSNQRWRYSDTGLAVTLSLSREQGKVPLNISVAHHPFWVDKESSNGNINYTVIPLLHQPHLKRLSVKDRQLMQEALSDFYDLYPHAKKTNSQ